MTGSGPTAAENPALRLVYAIGRFHTAMRAELGRGLAREGLTVPEFTALSVLGARSGLSNAQLARRSLVTPQAMNQVLASLEEKGLVSRPPEGAGATGSAVHHRARAVSLTASGRRAVRRAEAVVDGVETRAFAELDAAERTAFAELLLEGADRLRDAPAPPSARPPSPPPSPAPAPPPSPPPAHVSQSR